MPDSISLSLQPRTTFGKKNRALRRSGLIPVHVYGQDLEPLSLQVANTDVRLTLREAGATTPVTIKVEGGEEAVTLVREVSVHPVTGDLLHVDFMRVNIAEAVEAAVPLRLVNEDEAPGTRGGAGTVTQAIYEITVSALPFDIPHEIVVDCTVLVDLDADIKSGDLRLPAGVTLVSDPESRIAWIEPPRVAEEEPAAIEGEEGEEVEEAEGAEAEASGDGDEDEG